MITDRFPLTGTAAYLWGPERNFDLVATGGAGPSHGTSQAIGDHRVLDVDSIDLLFTAQDLTALLRRRVDPIIEVRTSKETFPQLQTDPFARCVHTIGGFDDLRRGSLENCRAMEIDGRPTLVFDGGRESMWTSPQFVFAEPLLLAELAWDLALSRLTPPDAFAYDLTVNMWEGSPNALVPMPPAQIAANANANTPRSARLVEQVTATALQVQFVARIDRDAHILERHDSDGSGMLGIPLLQAVHVLERRGSPMTFHSLHELNVASREFTLYGSGDSPLTYGIARLNYRAALTGNDAIELVLAPNVFQAFEARLSASIIERAPVTHR